MIQFFLHEASHLWEIGINKDDEKFKSCISVSVGDWKLVSFSKSFGSLFLNEKLGYWVSNSLALVTWGSNVDNFPEICARVGAYFGVLLSLPSSNKLKFIFSSEPVFKKEVGFERFYDYIQQHPESIPADARKAWKYLTPDKECFVTEIVKHSVCKNGEEVINSNDKFNGESIVCLHLQ